LVARDGSLSRALGIHWRGARRRCAARWRL